MVKVLKISILKYILKPMKEKSRQDEREVKARFSVSVIAEYGKNNIAKNKAKIDRKIPSRAYYQ